MMMTDEPDDRLRDDLVLLLASSQQDAQAIMRATGEAGIATQSCTADRFLQEVRAGLGAIILAEEAMSEVLVDKLAALIAEQPIWSDIPLIIMATPGRDASEHWALIQNAPCLSNATFLERPMRIATLLQTVNVALRGRSRQYRLRDLNREQEELLAYSEMNKRRLSAVLNNTRMAVFFMDERQQCAFMNVAAENLTGYSLAETQGQPLHDKLHPTHPDGTAYLLQDCPIDRAFPENNQTEGEEFFVHKDGHFYPVAFTASPIRQDNLIVGTVLEVHDITKKRADSERLAMMMKELNHRVKNTLATVQSIIVQTLQGEAVSDDVKDRIMVRLVALSRSHDLLTERSWLSAPLLEVAQRALAPFGAGEDTAGRFAISGDEFELHPEPALAIAMGLHELATNAVKYGALGVEGGSVDLSWKLIPGDFLQLKWVEQGGPPVQVPSHSGLGRRLIERGLAHQLGGEARFSFHHEGVVCEIDIPAAPALVAKKEMVGS